MRLSKITVSGFRSYAEETVIDGLDRINVFVGKNNAGKTNIIEILRLVNSLISGTPYRTPAEFMTRNVSRVMLTLEFALSDGERTQIIGALFNGGVVKPKDVLASDFLRNVTHTLRIVAGGIEQEDVTTPNLADGEVVVWSQLVDKGQVQVSGSDMPSECLHLEKIRNLSVDMKPRFRYGSGSTWVLLPKDGIKDSDFLPQMLREFYERMDWAPPIRQSQAQLAPKESRKLDWSGSNLAQVWSTILGDDPRDLVRIGANVEKIVGIASISSPVRGDQTAPSFKENSGLNFNLPNTSSGIQQAAILATKIRTSPLNGVLLIEEPELHLHAGAQRALREFIQNDSADIQFFITTHSTIFAEFGVNSKVYLVTRDGIQSKVKLITERDDLRLIKTELGHSNVDLYGYDAIVFVEGDSEEIALPTIAESLGFNFQNKGILIRNLKGAGKVKKLDQYLEYLKDSSTTAFVVADGNKEIRKKLADWEGSGLLPKGNYLVWPKEFEDLFPLSLIVESLSELGYKGVTIEGLEKETGNRSVVAAIIKLLCTSDQQELDKPALAESLAKKVSKDKTRVPKKLTELVEAVRKLRQPD